jgi:hypothetical protein
MTYDSVAGRKVETHMLDGNYVVASEHKEPWKKQLNILAAYLFFYNPARFLWGLVRPKSKLYLADSGMQIIGMYGLSQTIRRTFGWALRLIKGDIQRKREIPASPIPMRSVAGEAASHALPGTPQSPLVPLSVSAR